MPKGSLCHPAPMGQQSVLAFQTQWHKTTTRNKILIVKVCFTDEKGFDSAGAPTILTDDNVCCCRKFAGG